jgi:RES domain-containing protein
LAALEYFVNLDPVDAPADLVSVRVDLPRDLKLDRIAVSSLAKNWRSTPAPMELRDVGTNWLGSASSLCLMVPSAVIPEESNLLINPAHPDFGKLRFFRPRKFTFDLRMWKEALREKQESH